MNANFGRMKSLAASNRYLATAEMRRKAVLLNVASSSAIDGIRAPFKPAKAKPHDTAKNAPKPA